MLLGTYQHTVDSKGRVNFPAKLRDDLGERFYITSWFENCLVVFSEEGFREMYEKLRTTGTAQARTSRLFMGANATMVEPDKQGRILIPANLREEAGIQGEVAIVGAFDWAEIWDKDRWLAKKQENQNSETFAQNMLDNSL